MSTKEIRFELASPQKIAFNRHVYMASIPGEEGRFCVLAGHAPLAAKLEAGVVEIYEEGNGEPTDQFFVTGGYCEVSVDRCSVLANRVYRFEDLTAQEIEEEIEGLLSRADLSESPEEREMIADLIAIERAKLFAIAR